MSQQQQKGGGPETVDPKIEKTVNDYIKLDDEMKAARKQIKGARDAVNQLKKIIIEYLVRIGKEKITNINGDTQILECVQKTLKRRPTSEQMLEKIAELTSKGVTDPIVFLSEIQNCGGTYTEFRLSRRTKRVSAIAAAAAAASMASMAKMKRAKKRKVAMSKAAGP